MALSNILREFLVKIGYDNDEAGQQKFIKGVTKATEVVLALGAAIEATAVAVVAGIAKMSDGMERFYFVSQRTGAAVANIKALGFAADQMGIGAESAYSALENLASFLRSSPQASLLLKQMGVSDKAIGSKDPAQMLAGIGQAFARMPVSMANAYAQVLGIDERTMLALRQGMGEYLDDYNAILKKVGVSEEKAAAASHKFMLQWRHGTALLNAFKDKIIELVSGKAGIYLEQFMASVEKNFDKITDGTSTLVGWLLVAAAAFARLGARGVEALGDLYDAFMKLPDVVRYVLEAIAGLMIAFAAFDWPILAVGLLATALLSLYDDYKTWKEGGEHLIDWQKWEDEARHFKDKIMPYFDAFRHFWKELTPYFDTAMHALVDSWMWMMSMIQPGLDGLMEMFHKLESSALGRWIGRKLDAGEKAVNHATLKQQIEDLKNYGWGGGAGADTTTSPADNGANGNVGNMRVPGSKTEWQKFSSAQAGLVAIGRQLQRYGKRGMDTIASMITTYAPPSENDTATYIKNMSAWTGFGANDHLNLNDQNVMSKLLYGITRQEGHAQPQSALNSAARDVTVSQQNTYNIHGSGDPHATAKAVGAAQETSNQRLVRNFTPVAV